MGVGGGGAGKTCLPAPVSVSSPTCLFFFARRISFDRRSAWYHLLECLFFTTNKLTFIYFHIHRNDWQLVLHFMAVLQQINFQMEISMLF